MKLISLTTRLCLVCGIRIRTGRPMCPVCTSALPAKMCREIRQTMEPLPTEDQAHELICLITNYIASLRAAYRRN